MDMPLSIYLQLVLVYIIKSGKYADGTQNMKKNAHVTGKMNANISNYIYIVGPKMMKALICLKKALPAFNNLQ